MSQFLKYEIVRLAVLKRLQIGVKRNQPRKHTDMKPRRCMGIMHHQAQSLVKTDVRCAYTINIHGVTGVLQRSVLDLSKMKHTICTRCHKVLNAMTRVEQDIHEENCKKQEKLF